MKHIKPPSNPLELLAAEPSAASELFSNPRYRQVALQCEASYRHWDKVRYIASAKGLKPELLWIMIKMGRLSQTRDLPFLDKHGQKLTYTLPARVQQELMMIDQQMTGNIRFEDGPALRPALRDGFIVSSMMEEAIASSQLEGASTVHRVAKEMLRKNRTPNDLGERMIVNNYHAINFIRNHISTPLSFDLLIELQRILTDGTLDKPDQCGRLRTADETVVVEDPYGEELHVPPHANALKDRLKDLCEFANTPAMSSDPFIHPVVRAIALHFQLAYDHPFCDGNGRTARTLFYWSMLRSGYWLFEFLPISRLINKGPSQYGRAFQYVESDNFDLTYFLDYHTRVIRLARRDFRDKLAQQQRENRTRRKLFRSHELNDRQSSLLMSSLSSPHAEYTIEWHRTRHRISYFTARDDLLNLEKLGYLEKRRIGKKFVFSATPLVQQHAEHE